MPEKYVLRQYQALPLNAKVSMTKARIREWYEHWNGDVFVSFSGGKDSTVLGYLVNDMYPHIPLVFCNTGLEFPEIRQFAEKKNAVVIRPQMRFDEVISTYGYPLISKETSEAIYTARMLVGGGEKWKKQKRDELLGLRKGGGGPDGKSYFNKDKWLPLSQNGMFRISHMCCKVMKKAPFAKYIRETKTLPYIGTLTEESRLREQRWTRHGCNEFEGNHKSSQPMSFWKEQDVLRFILEEKLLIADVYGEIVGYDKDGYEYKAIPEMDCKLKCSKCDRTGCIFCAFGEHLEKGQTKFQKLAFTHPKQYEYCLGGGQWVDNPGYDPSAPKYDGDWLNWNPKKIWVPSKKGLGMKHVFDECKKIFGKDFICYE